MLLLVASAFAVPTLNEHFDSGALPAGWKSGAQGSGGKPSAVAYAGGEVVLTTKANDKRFATIQKTVEIRGAAWIKVGGKVTVDVASPARDAVCGVFVQFDRSPLQAAHACVPGPEPLVFTRFLPVPAGVYMVDVGAMLDAPGTVRVDDVTVEVVLPEDKRLERGHFNYHWIGYEGFSEAQLSANDETLDKLVIFFGTGEPADIDYWWFKDLDTIEQYTGRREEGQVSGRTIASIRRNDPHELVRVMASAWGDPPSALLEGIAVYIDGEYDGRDPKLATRAMVGSHEAPELDVLLDDARFAALPEATAKLTAGAFVGWIVDTKGKDTLKALCGKLGAGSSGNVKALEEVLGMPIADVQKAFWAGI